MRSRIKRIALGLLLAGFVWCAILATIIWRYGAHDYATKADCIIILGAAVQGTTPSPVFEERIRHGIDLYHAGFAPKLLFTGGIGEGQEHSEGSVGRSVATQQGVPVGDILIEERSRTTQQNLTEARSVMQKHGLKSAIIVSDPLHMKRAMMMADGLDMDAVSSPTPTTRYRSLQTKLGFLVRELYFFHHYVLTGN
ncbi:MAG: YdcF family protein [Verrucomicrobia bacterium]|nr:YdcF family protein [Verrucomicrobiota bacterium]